MNPLLSVLLESSLRIAGAAIVAAVALKVARVRASAVTHAVWTGVLYAMLLMPGLPYLVPPITPPVPAPKVTIVADRYEFDSETAFAPPLSADPPPMSVTNSPAPSAPVAAPRASGAPLWPIVLSAIWGLGALFLLARFGAGWMAMRGVVRRSGTVQPFEANNGVQPDHSRAVAARRSEERRQPRRADPTILESSEVMVPVTVGAVSPRVLLP
jgi:hypothetical protein